MTISGNHQQLLGVVIFSALLAGCASTPGMPAGAAAARDNLSRLQSDPQLASRAPMAISQAESAVLVAEQSGADRVVGEHRVVMADRAVEIARAQAQARLYEDEREQLIRQREQARLDSRTLEADQLRQQLAMLNTQETDRGVVITLGDLLFATGKSTLRGGNPGNLDQLARFLNDNPDRSLLIEGHTDSVGSLESNQYLSHQRAQAVQHYLQARGIAASRIQARGLGEEAPVADNSNAYGRQQNRRVEVIINHH